jgi:hypothetical protein
VDTPVDTPPPPLPLTRRSSAAGVDSAIAEATAAAEAGRAAEAAAGGAESLAHILRSPPHAAAETPVRAASALLLAREHDGGLRRQWGSAAPGAPGRSDDFARAVAAFRAGLQPPRGG